MTFCILSEKDVLAKMQRATNKNYILTVVSDLTGSSRGEMSAWLSERGFNINENGRSHGMGKIRY